MSNSWEWPPRRIWSVILSSWSRIWVFWKLCIFLGNLKTERIFFQSHRFHKKNVRRFPFGGEFLAGEVLSAPRRGATTEKTHLRNTSEDVLVCLLVPMDIGNASSSRKNVALARRILTLFLKSIFPHGKNENRSILRGMLTSWSDHFAWRWIRVFFQKAFRPRIIDPRALSWLGAGAVCNRQPPVAAILRCASYSYFRSASIRLEDALTPFLTGIIAPKLRT